MGAIVHALGADHDAWLLLELTIGRERQPQRLEIVRGAGEFLFLKHAHLLKAAT